jgi:hypothetical protein
MLGIRRREFITLLGGSGLALPFAARAQQAARMRRIGGLNAVAADDPQSQRRMTAFLQSLQQLGWTDGRNNLKTAKALALRCRRCCTLAPTRRSNTFRRDSFGGVRLEK